MELRFPNPGIPPSVAQEPKATRICDFFLIILAISAFSAQLYPEFRRIEDIQGGVEEVFLHQNLPSKREAKALFVGRILPHKGIDYLIEAMPPVIM